LQFDEILVSGGKRGLSVGVSAREMQEKMGWIIASIAE
ncbi:MAG: Cys-tRNA(Pro) deacylase, partial [Aeromonas sp.]